MTTTTPTTIANEIEAARLLLARLGVTAEQLLTGPTRRDSVPIFSEYIDRVSEAVSSGTRRVYDSYWRRLREQWGQRRLDEPTPLEIRQLCEQVRANVVVRRNARGGRTAAEHMISALRCLYQYAVDDGYLAEADNPAIRVAKPRRLASTRRALADHQLAQINEVAGSTGNDPDLDSLILRVHTETACRRGGAVALCPRDLDEQQSLIRLREKGETVRWQPVSPTLMKHLLLMRDERGTGDAADQLLRYRGGRPITYRRYDHLWGRIGKHLPWVATQGISTHWLRHTTLTWVERRFGYAVARAYAGHSGRNDAGTTSTYVRADLYEVAQALAALTAEAHPLAATAVVRDHVGDSWLHQPRSRALTGRLRTSMRRRRRPDLARWLFREESPVDKWRIRDHGSAGDSTPSVMETAQGIARVGRSRRQHHGGDCPAGGRPRNLERTGRTPPAARARSRSRRPQMYCRSQPTRTHMRNERGTGDAADQLLRYRWQQQQVQGHHWMGSITKGSCNRHSPSSAPVGVGGAGVASVSTWLGRDELRAA